MTTSTTAIASQEMESNQETIKPRRQLAAAMIGNALEYYDFIVYAFLASVLGRKFFAGGDEVMGLLASFATFGVGFLARPLGGIVIGRIADTLGRKLALQITIFGMAIGTVGIGLLPTYQDVGVIAPVLLVSLRLIQGLAAGGEWGSSTSLIVESAPEGKRGLFGAYGQTAIASSNLLSSLAVAGVTAMFSAQQMDGWAWRLPFLFGGVLLAVGLWMRRTLHETPKFEEAKAAGDKAVKPSRQQAIVSMARAFGFTIIWTVSYYVMLSYLPTFLVKHVGLTQLQALTTNSIALVVLVLTTPIFGWLSDRWGRKPLLLASCIVFALFAYPLFSLLLKHPSVGMALAIQVFFNVFIAAFSGAAPAALCELFPTKSRTTLLSIGYSLATAIFGGFAAFIATGLIQKTGSPISPSYYLIFAAIVSGITILTLKETAHKSLD